MKKYLLLYIVILLTSISSFAQIQFVRRVEHPVKPSEDNYTIMPYSDGLVAFRSQPEKGNSYKKRLEYFVTDEQLNSGKLQDFALPDYYDLVGYDISDQSLYIILIKNSVGKERMLYEVGLETGEVKSHKISSTLTSDLQEFFVINKRAVFMGIKENRPVVQIYDIALDNVFTLQGIYANDTKILQMRKDSELEVFDVVMSKRDFYKNKLVTILTFDVEGNKLREVNIDRLEDPKMEIVEGVLTHPTYYKQAMVGPFGLRRKEAFQGIYLSTINEFGEYINSYYTLADLPNFYNYLPERRRNRKLRSLEKNIEKEKRITIPNVLATREVISSGDYFLIYNDYFSPSSTRSSSRDGMYHSGYYNNSPVQRRFSPFSYGMWPGAGPMPLHQNYRQFRYLSAQFLLLSAKGELIWDNSLALKNNLLPHEQKFGEVSFNGSDLYFMYLDNTDLRLSHISDGEVLMENESFPLELVNENETIRDTQESSLSLMWWYDQYYLLSGKQRVRFYTESGREENKEVFFITKIRVY